MTNTVDLISGMIIGGVGAALAAMLLVLIRASDPWMVKGLRVCIAAFLILAVSMCQAAFVSGPYAAMARLILGIGPVLSLVVFALGFRLIHQRATERAEWWCWAASAVLMILGGYLYSDRAFSLAIATGCLVYSIVLVVYCWPDLLSRELAAPKVLGIVLVGLVAISAVRLVQTAVYDGPTRDHLVYVPIDQLWFHAIFYGVMPLLTGVMLLSIINGQLEKSLRYFVDTDELTLTLSRRGLQSQAPTLIAACRAARRQVLAMMLDLDNFKVLNDRYGHQFGDTVLQKVAACLRDELRSEALLSRFGGEEFLFLIPFDGKRVDEVVAQRLRGAVKRLDIRASNGEQVPVTVSVGCAVVKATGEEHRALDDAVQRADRALYEAKSAGRDCVRLDLALT